MEHRSDTDMGPEVLRIGSDREKGVGRCSKQDANRLHVRPELPAGHGTTAPPPRPPPVGRFARGGTHTALVEDQLRRSVPTPAPLLSCRLDPAESRCPTA